jgi:hypothetical protein
MIDKVGWLLIIRIKTYLTNDDIMVLLGNFPTRRREN